MHFPALDDAEAVITCRDGDPDKPEIVAFHHHSQARDLVTNDRRWLSRNVIRTQKNNKLRMEDWAGQEGIKLSTEHSGKSQLNLGYLVNSKLEYRGEGYELRSSGWGALRAGKGVMVTTYDRPGANGKQLDMQETIAQLESALATAKALAASASSAKAEPADTDAQQQMKDDLDGLKKPGLLMSTPASAGIVAGGGVQFAAQDSISTVAGKNADWSVTSYLTEQIHFPSRTNKNLHGFFLMETESQRGKSPRELHAEFVESQNPYGPPIPYRKNGAIANNVMFHIGGIYEASALRGHAKWLGGSEGCFAFIPVKSIRTSPQEAALINLENGFVSNKTWVNLTTTIEKFPDGGPNKRFVVAIERRPPFPRDEIKAIISLTSVLHDGTNRFNSFYEKNANGFL
jgi:hypothetical protein